MTTDKHCLQSPLPTELEILRLNLKDQSLNIRQVETSTRAPWLGYSVSSTITAVLLCRDSWSVHTIRYCHLLHRLTYDDRT
jgi:hypothetical protein